MTFDLFSSAPSPSSNLSEAEQIARLRLIRTDSIGPITFRQLMSRFENASLALEEVAEMAARGGRKKPLKIPSKASIERELEAVAKFGAISLHVGEEPYPKMLAACEDAPPVLFAKGHTHLLEKETIGIVGARNASAAGIKLTRKIASDLGEANLVVASGLARGVDTAAHVAALDGGTVACVAGGLDVIYPRENTELHHQIIEVGCVISEMPLGTKPQARHFPRRNRLISGLSLGLLVVEAAYKSGSLITARQASDQGREVFAVPGSPLDPRSAGTNKLIQDGAKLTTSARDILDELNDMRRRPLSDPAELPLFASQPAREQDIASAREKVRELLSPTPTEIDDIIRLSGEETSTVLAILLEFELAGIATRHPGNQICLA